MMEFLLFLGFLLGAVGRIPLSQSVAVSVLDVTVCLYVFSHVGDVWKKRKQLVHDPVILPASVFIAICLVSLCINGFRFPANSVLAGFLYFLRYAGYALLYPVIRAGKKPDGYWIRFLFAAGVGIAILGLAQLLLYPNLRNLTYLGWDPHFYRLFSTTFDPNFTGIILVLSLILGWHLYREDAKRKRMMLVCEGILLVALVFTFSRSAYVSLISAALVYIVLSRRWKLLAAVGVFVGIVLCFPAIGGISTSVWRGFTVSARIVNWQESIGLFLASPIIGHGFDLLRAVRSVPLEPGITETHAAGGLDNSFLFVLTTTGIMGFFAYLWFLITCIVRAAAHPKNRQMGSMGVMYILSLIAICVDSQFINSLFYPMIVTWFWILSASVFSGKGKMA